jgi:hypothetical protein
VDVQVVEVGRQVHRMARTCAAGCHEDILPAYDPARRWDRPSLLMLESRSPFAPGFLLSVTKMTCAGIRSTGDS